MKTLLLLALLLSATPAAANPLMMWAAMGNSGTPFTINGYSAVTTDSGEAGGSIALNNTGTESITTGAGSVTVAVSCQGTTEETSLIQLIVDGSGPILSCDYSENKTATLSATVTAGAHDIQVFASRSGPGGYAQGNNFRKP